jgi:hypothetical protein
MRHLKHLPHIISVILIALLNSSFATQVASADLSKLTAQSQLVIVAKVLSVTPVELNDRKDKPYDSVHVQISTVLKGELKEETINVILEPRGVRDFDPVLKVGQSGVFFLNLNAQGHYRLTASGAVAIFERGSFLLGEPSAQR